MRLVVVGLDVLLQAANLFLVLVDLVAVVLQLGIDLVEHVYLLLQVRVGFFVSVHAPFFILLENVQLVQSAIASVL